MFISKLFSLHTKATAKVDDEVKKDLKKPDPPLSVAKALLSGKENDAGRTEDSAKGS